MLVLVLEKRKFLDKNVQYTFEDENEYDDEKKNDEDRVPLK